MRGIDFLDFNFHADLLQRALEMLGHFFLVAGLNDDRECQNFTSPIDHARVLDAPARFFEKAHDFAQDLAVAARTIGHRQLIGTIEIVCPQAICANDGDFGRISFLALRR